MIATLASLVSVGPLAAQSGTVTGRVTDAQSLAPIASASVLIEELQIGVLTQGDGTYLLRDVPVGTHVVTAQIIGYAPVTMEVQVTSGGTARADFSLSAQAVVLEELVVTGYGTQRRVAITGSVATVQAADANVGVTTNANNLVQGRIAGLSVTLNDGEPGTGAQVRIRGGTSISASNEPLYVVDGVPIQNVPTEAGGIGTGGSPSLPRSPLNLINPNDIESITVLKDASATAIYGARAANGVVLIQTKTGDVTGTTSIEYDGYVTASTPASYLDLLNGSEYRTFVQDQVAAGNLGANRLDGLGAANTDWERALTRTAVTHNHNLAFSGGTNQTRYRASLNYMNQEGIVESSAVERIQGRLNGRHTTLDGRLDIGLNLMSAYVFNDYLQFENTGGFEGGVFQNMAIYNPTNPVTVRDPDTGEDRFYEIGSGRLSVRNPVAIANQLADEAGTTRTLGNLNTSLEINDWLTGQMVFGIDRSSSTRRTYFPGGSPIGAEWNGRAVQAAIEKTDITFQGLLTANRTYGDQSIEIKGGYEFADYQYRGFASESRDFLTDAFSFNSLGGGAQQVPPYSFQTDSRIISVFGRAAYSLNDKYFLTGVLRYDGASVFGARNKWALFPAISGSWRISDEDFAQDWPFSNLAFRAGWGLQGNQAVQPYQSLILLAPNDGLRYVFGEDTYTGVAPVTNANPDLKWEESTQVNAAIDFGFNDNRISGSLEFYEKNTKDLLLTVPVAQPAPVTNRLENIGELRWRGVEASLDAIVKNTANMTWEVGMVFAAERNEVKNLGGRTFISTGGVSGQGQSGQISQRIIPGESLGTFWGPEFIGHNAAGEQLFNQYSVTRDADGNITSREIIGETTNPGGDDFTIIGNAVPDFELGIRSNLTWGAFDASVLVRSVVGQDVFNNTALVYSTKGNALQDKNFLRTAIDDGTGITQPAIYSSRWIESGSFMRVQNLTVGYTFEVPGQGRTARAYVSSDNLLLLTGYDGYDPEVFTDAGLAVLGIDYLSYPRARTFTFGLRVNF
jgi:iron complex outermembrane receptor protein